jgi:hypothetical protein
MKVGTMKRAAAILMIMVMIFLWQQALSLGGSDPTRSLGTDRSMHSLAGSDIKKMEEKMAEALAALPSSQSSNAGGDHDKSPAGIDWRENSSRENSSINSSLHQNGSFNNSSLDDNRLDGAEGSPWLTGRQIKADNGSMESGSGSANRFKGTYASRASRHEIGKGGVDSSIFLKGEFEMDKSIKFQDRGF